MVILLLIMAFTTPEDQAYIDGLEVYRENGSMAALDYFEDCHHESGFKRCQYGHAFFLWVNNQPEKALVLAELLAITETTGRTSADVNYLLGNLYSELGRFEEAVEPISIAIDTYRSLKQTENEFSSKLSLARVYLTIREYALAESVLISASSSWPEDKQNIGWYFQLQTTLAIGTGRIKHAEKFANEALRAFEQIGNTQGVSDCLSDLSVIAWLRGDRSQAYNRLEAAREHCKDCDKKETSKIQAFFSGKDVEFQGPHWTAIREFLEMKR